LATVLAHTMALVAAAQPLHVVKSGVPQPPNDPQRALEQLLTDGITWGDALAWLPALPPSSVDLFFTSPPYADARAYSRIHPDRYVEWFLDFARPMLAATKDTGWFVLNIKNRVTKSGPLRGQRHPYVYELVLALQHMGWRWIESYIWAKPNSIPGRFGPRTKDSYEYVYAFARGVRPMFDLNAVRVAYKTTPSEIARRNLDERGRRNTDAGFGRDRTKTYAHGGADPGNVVTVAQSYNQHYGPAGEHTAVMPEGPGRLLRQGVLAARWGCDRPVRGQRDDDRRRPPPRAPRRRLGAAQGARRRGAHEDPRRRRRQPRGRPQCRCLTQSAPCLPRRGPRPNSTCAARPSRSSSPSPAPTPTRPAHCLPDRSSRAPSRRFT